MTKVFIATFFVILFMTNLEAQRRPEFTLSYRGFVDYYKQRLTHYGIVGSGFVLVQNEQVVGNEFYGLACREENCAQIRTVNEDTIFHWASITKTFTAIAIMQLRDRGLLSLDDPIVKYVPELRAVHNSFGKMEDITIRQLLTHSAGFRGGTWPWGGDKDWHPFEPHDWSQLVAMFPYTQVEFKPSSKHSYSNPGYVYLGRVIESLAHEDFEVYVDKNILKPLQMYHSYFDTTPYHLLKYRSHSYYVQDGKTTAAVFDADTGITVSNSGLNSPLADMTKYLQFLLGSHDAKQQEIYEGLLKRTTLAEMWQPQIKIETPKNEAATRQDAMGLGFFIEDNFGQHLIGHSGNQNGFLAHFYLRPDIHAAYVVAFNTQVIAKENEHDTGQNTRALDTEIKTYLCKNILPLLSKN